MARGIGIWKKIFTNGLELIKRTGKIFTARSYYHGNTSKSWVKHKLTQYSVILALFGALGMYSVEPIRSIVIR